MTKPQQRRVVMSVDDFAHRKGVTKALQGFRERKEKKRVATAKALRSYSKVMRQEGYEPGKGASRKRKAESSRDNDDNKQESSQAAAADSTAKKPGDGNRKDNNNNNNKHPSTATFRSKRQRSHIFQKSQAQAEQRKLAFQKDAEDRIRREAERQQKLSERRYRSKKLRQRTRRGQPVMKNIVDDILHKLEREEQH